MVELKGLTVMVLGGGGQVGIEISKQLLNKHPSKLVLCCLEEAEALSSIEILKRSSRGLRTTIVPEWGNIFVRADLKAKSLKEISSDPSLATLVVQDVFSELNDKLLKNSFLFQLIDKHKPDIVIDSINTATALAYQDIYSQISREESPSKWLYLASSLDLPQLVRHIQILFHSLKKAGTTQYLKIGTSGTGGLGLTLPYTHGETEVPSRLLMSKSGVAGAQSMLLWILSRTPGSPRIMEIKVTALIGWKKIGKGTMRVKNKPIELYDCAISDALPISSALVKHSAVKTGKHLEGAWIDTGENGIFTRDMFAAISAPYAMELITPEEIAEVSIRELSGETTGKDIISALDHASLGPSFLAMNKREEALKELLNLGGEDVASIPTLGPLTSKVLWEARILQTAFHNLGSVIKADPLLIQQKTFIVVKLRKDIRSSILSVGIPILLPNEKLLRGPHLSVPSKSPESYSSYQIEKWASIGWVDLRAKNWAKWVRWLKNYQYTLRTSPGIFSNSNKDFDVGKVCGHIFSRELGGLRLKR